MKHQETRIWLAGWFERAPECDLMPASENWRAWRYLGDGGIWYARDDETYEVVRKAKCYSCGGKGRPAVVWCDGTGECAGEARNGAVCSVCGFNGPCRICDGRGFVFIATKVNQG